MKLRVAACLATLSLSPAMVLGQDANRAYLEGADAFEDGRYAEAIQSFETAVDAKPEAGGRIRRGGAMLIDYTPYAMLAIAYSETSQCEQAFDTWRRGGGFAATRGRASDLRTRTTAAHDGCRTQLVAAAQARVASLDLASVEALSRDQYVAPQWESRFAGRYAGLDSEIDGMRTGLQEMALASPLDPDALTAITAVVPELQSQITQLRRDIEQAAVPPAAPDPAPSETPPPAAEPEPEPAAVASTPANAPEPTTAVPVETAPSGPDTTTPSATPAPTRPAAAITAAAAPRRDANPEGIATTAVLRDRLNAALAAYYSRGDLDDVLRQTDTSSSPVSSAGGDTEELLWQLRILRAAAFYSQARLGLSDDGLASARAAITAAQEMIPDAEPNATHFPAGFVEFFATTATGRS